MSKPLDYAELEKAALELMSELSIPPMYREAHRASVLVALTDIAKRALEQAARPEYGGSVIYVGRFPSIPLSDAFAALEKPKEPTTKEIL